MDTPGRAGRTPEAGLCASCAHATVVTSARGSAFSRCDLSFTDERFPRYPRLPVLACSGYTPADEERKGPIRGS